MGEVHLVDPGEAFGCTERNSKSKLRPVLTTCLTLKGHLGPEAMGTKSKFIILNVPPRNTGLARALIPILQKNQLRHMAVLCAQSLSRIQLFVSP